MGDGFRRAFRASALAGALAVLCCTFLYVGNADFVGKAHAIAPENRVRIVQIRYSGGRWNPRPQATTVLAQEVAFRTSTETSTEPIHRTLEAKDLFHFPILILSGDQGFPAFPERHVERLKHHVEAGGTLLVDNCGESQRSYLEFDRSIRRLMSRMFPGRTLKPVPSEHVLYRSFFRLDYPSGRNLRKGYMETVTVGSRAAVLYMPNDLGGALERDRFGTWAYDLIPGTGRQREMAIRLGGNITLYALCLHYKDDQVHLRYLLKKRSWRIKPPKSP